MDLNATLRGFAEEESFIGDPPVKPSESSSPLITNDPTLTNANGEATRIPQAAPRVIQRPPTFTDYTNSLFQGIRSQMDQIGKETDPLKKDSAISALKGSIAETGAILSQQTRILAEQQTGLPQLQAALRRAEQLDRADPLWNQHLVDSRETQRIRQQVEQAHGKSLQLAKQMINENPTIQGMTATLDSFLKNQEALVRSDLNREEKRRDLVEQEMLTLGDDTAKYLSYLYPEVNGDVRKAAEVKLSARTDPNKKELAPILSTGFTEDQLLPLAFMGNKPAQHIAVKAQAEKVGQDVESVKKELSTANKFVNDEGFFIQQMQELSTSDPLYKQILTEYTKNNMLGGKGKEAEKQKMMQRAGLVDQWITKKKTDVVLNNVESWNGFVNLKANPDIAASIDKIKTLNPGKPVSTDMLIGDYVLTAPKEQQAQRLDQIKLSLKSTIENSKKGLYGHLDEVALMNKLKISQGFSSASFGAFVDSFGDTMANYINTNPGAASPSLGGVR